MMMSKSLAAVRHDCSKDSDADTVIAKCKEGLRRGAISLQLRGLWNGSSLIRGLYVFPHLDKIEEDYPDKLPRLFFRSEILHPLINSQGEFNLKQSPASRDPRQASVLELLCYVKDAFTTSGLETINKTHCVNPDAYDAFFYDKQLYETNAAHSALRSTTNAVLYDNMADDPLKMIEIKDENEFNEIRSKVLSKILNMSG